MTSSNLIAHPGPSLAPEILHHIVSFIDDEPTLKISCGTSKALLDPAQRKLFRHLDLQSMNWAVALRLHTLLKSSPHLTAYIYSLSVPREAGSRFLELLNTLPNLRALIFKTLGTWNATYYDLKNLSNITTLDIRGEDIPLSFLFACPQIASLTLLNADILTDEPDVATSPYPVFPHLRYLKMDATRNGDVTPRLVNMANDRCFPSLQCLLIPEMLGGGRVYFPEEDLPPFLNQLHPHLKFLDIDFWPLTSTSILLGPNNPLQLGIMSNLVAFRMLYARTRAGLETANHLQWLISMLESLSAQHPLRMVVLAGADSDRVSSIEIWRDLDDALHSSLAPIDIGGDPALMLKLPDFTSLVIPMNETPVRLKEKGKTWFRKNLPRTYDCDQLTFEDVEFEELFWRGCA